MIEIELPKDITKYEAKLAGVATKRQAVCVAISAVVLYGIKMLCETFGLYEIKGFLMTVGAILPMTFAVWKPYNMNLEDFLEQAFMGNVVAPTKRKYVSENVYAEEYQKMVDEEHKIIGAYNKVYGLYVPQRRINDPKDRPRQKINKRNPELTGYL